MFHSNKGVFFNQILKYLTGLDYEHRALDFIRKKNWLDNFKARACIQPCLKTLGINLGYYSGKEIFLRNISEGNKALLWYNNHFYLIWKSQGVGFKKVVEERTLSFKIFNKCITEESVSTLFEYEYEPKKIESQLTRFIAYD